MVRVPPMVRVPSSVVLAPPARPGRPGPHTPAPAMPGPALPGPGMPGPGMPGPGTGAPGPFGRGRDRPGVPLRPPRGGGQCLHMHALRHQVAP